MERLHKRSDGIAETPSGNIAVSFFRRTGRTEDGFNWFSFKPSVTSPAIRIEWKGAIAVIPEPVGQMAMKGNFARPVSDAQIAAWNAQVDVFLKAMGGDPEAQAILEGEKSTEEATEGLSGAETVEDTGEGADSTLRTTSAESDDVAEGNEGEETPADEKPTEEQAAEIVEETVEEVAEEKPTLTAAQKRQAAKLAAAEAEAAKAEQEAGA